MKNNLLTVIAFCLMLSLNSYAQADRWQQHVNYNIKVSLDVNTNTMKGVEEVTYDNNSPDTLHKVYFHMYWNAFQPNSAMDIRSRELGKTFLSIKRGAPVTSASNMSLVGQNDRQDWDARVKDRIQNLSQTEIGIQKVNKLTINGVAQKLIEHETILEVQLSKPIAPHSSVKMSLNFEAQVPIQIRRSGRDNNEGIRYSMSQWYPKMVEYDYQGWNTNPYIAREFYGVWGNYNVSINLPKNYTIGGTGVIENPNALADVSGNKTWIFSIIKFSISSSYKHKI